MVSVEHEVAFVVVSGHGTVTSEIVDGPLDNVAVLVGLRVEPGWSATPANAGGAVAGLVGGSG